MSKQDKELFERICKNDFDAIKLVGRAKLYAWVARGLFDGKVTDKMDYALNMEYHDFKDKYK